MEKFLSRPWCYPKLRSCLPSDSLSRAAELVWLNWQGGNERPDSSMLGCCRIGLVPNRNSFAVCCRHGEKIQRAEGAVSTCSEQHAKHSTSPSLLFGVWVRTVKCVLQARAWVACAGLRRRDFPLRSTLSPMLSCSFPVRLSTALFFGLASFLFSTCHSRGSLFLQ